MSSNGAFPTFARIPGLLFHALVRLFVWFFRMLLRRWKPVLGTLLIIAVIYAAASAVLSYKVSRELARIKAEGSPVEMSDLAGPAVPDSENGALIYEQAFEGIRAIERSRLFNDFYYRENDSPSFLPRPKAHSEAWWNDAYALFRRYDRAYYSKVLQAQAMPTCYFQYDYSTGRDITNTVNEHLEPLMSLGRVLSLRSLAMARQGKVDEAVDSLVAEVRLQKAIAHGQTLFHTLTGYAILYRATDTAAEVAQLSQLTEAQAQRLDRVLASTDPQPSLISGLNAERALCIWGYRASRKDPSALRSLGIIETSSLAPISLRIRPLFYADFLAYLRATRKHLDLSRLPYREAQDGIAQCDEKLAKLPRFWLSPFLGSVPGPFMKRRDTAIADLSGARIVIALHQYKQRYGQFPPSLAVMSSTLKWTAPIDPFAGGPFKYKRQGDGFLLYSIGGDLKDNDGVEERAIPVQRREGDIVWRE